MFGAAEEVASTETKTKVHRSQFQILKQLGRGSYGKVYLVKKTEGTLAGASYAMKVMEKARLSDTALLRTQSERDILTKLSHPFLAKLHYAFQTEGKMFMVFDFLGGGDMHAMLKRKGHFTEREVAFYSGELALALNHLHSLSIIHRDLKPENVMIGADGHVVLTDFGLSKETTDVTYSYCGTVDYMAPEIITGEGHTASSDWWSFGVLIFKFITGKLLFRGKNCYRVSQAIVKTRFDIPTYLSDEAVSIILCLVQKNPDDRLTAGPNGMATLQRHPFYDQINWEKLSDKRVPPPYEPQLLRDDDTSHFKSKYTESTISDFDGNSSSEGLEEAFPDFDYIGSIENAIEADMERFAKIIHDIFYTDD